VRGFSPTLDGSGREDAPAEAPDVFDCEESLRCGISDQFPDPVQVLPVDNGIDHLDGPVRALTVQAGHAESFRSQQPGKSVFLLEDDPDGNLSDRHFFLNEHPDEIAHRKPGRIGDEIDGAGEVFHYLGDGYQPQEDLEETNDGRKQFHALGDVDDPDGHQGDIHYPGKK